MLLSVFLSVFGIQQARAQALDTDADGVADSNDNCTMVANPAQTDIDNDGFGNACDADFDNSNLVSFGDLALFRQGFLSSDPLVDLDEDGRVGFGDLSLFFSLFGSAPGPGGSQGSPFGLSDRETVATLPFLTTTAGVGEFDFTNAYPDESFAFSVAVAAIPGTDHIAVVNKVGAIRAVSAVSDTQASQPFINVIGRVSDDGEAGLIGLAFDPDYANTRRFYVYYRSRFDTNVISRFTAVAGDLLQGDASSEEQLIEFSHPSFFHQGGSMAFGPDGNLYVSVGDGAVDPQAAQDRSNRLGAILRLDVSAASGYSAAANNPFVDEGSPADEIWAYGFRNPWRMSFDQVSNRLWVADVGESEIEEINIVSRGENYGWPSFEGSMAFQGDGTSDMVAPLYEYSHPGNGNSVTGGYVYRGQTAPGLIGQYIYGDFGSGRIWSLVYAGEQVVSNTEIDNIPSLATFGEGHNGELYAASFSNAGSIFRLSQGDGPMLEPPALLSATGIFASLTTLDTATGFIELEPNASSWSDNAEKRRWMALPDQQTINFSNNGIWTFPVGTVFVKHFEIELQAGQPNSRQRLETRVLVNTQDGWTAYTYKWQADGSDAQLLTGGESETLEILQQDGSSRQQTYTFPSRAECIQCHTLAAGGVLGVNTRQLNKDFDYPNATDNQLRSWNNIGLFNTDIGAPSTLSAMPDPEDFSISLENRAKAYLDVNCSQCHRPGGTTPDTMDLRFQTPLASMQIIGEQIIPGDAQNSPLVQRMRATGNQRMPPIDSELDDDAGVALLSDWIDAM